MKVFRVRFELTHDLRASDIEDARERAEWARVGIGAYQITPGRFDPKREIEIIDVLPCARSADETA